MAVNIPQPSRAAFAAESTQGTPPANGAAWVSDGKRIKHLDLDISGLRQPGVEDQSSQERGFGLNRRGKGLKNVEFPISVYCQGIGATTGSGDQAAEDNLDLLVEQALGGLWRGTTLTAAGTHSTTTVEVADASALEVGGYVAWEHPTTKICYPRRIVDITSDVITLDQALPQAAQDDDLIRAVKLYYVDEAKIVDSAEGPTTSSWLLQKGIDGPGTDAYQCMGCMAQLNAIEFPRGDHAKMTFTVHVSSFLDPRDAPEPDWDSAPYGAAPIVVASDTTLWIQDDGTTTSNSLKPASVSVDVGVPRVPYETNTEAEDNMEGRGGYSFEPADTLITIPLAGLDTDFLDDWDADTYKTIRYVKHGLVGKGFFVAAHKAEIFDGPNWAAGTTNQTNLVFRAHPDDASADATTDALWESKIVIGRF